MLELARALRTSYAGPELSCAPIYCWPAQLLWQSRLPLQPAVGQRKARATTGPAQRRSGKKVVLECLKLQRWTHTSWPRRSSHHEHPRSNQHWHHTVSCLAGAGDAAARLSPNPKSQASPATASAGTRRRRPLPDPQRPENDLIGPFSLNSVFDRAMSTISLLLA